MITNQNRSWYGLYKFSFRNKIDLLSKKLSKLVLDKFIKHTGHGKFQFIVNYSMEKDFLDYNLKEMVFTIDPYAISFSVVGNYLPDTNAVVIGMELPIGLIIDKVGGSVKKDMYSSVFQEIKYTVRHELEHAYYNETFGCSENGYDLSSHPNSFMQYVLLTRQYLLHPSEIDSYIREMMLRAKNEKIPIDSLLVKFVDSKIKEVSPELMNNEISNRTKDGVFYQKTIDEILAAYRNRIREIYGK